MDASAAAAQLARATVFGRAHVPQLEALLASYLKDDVKYTLSMEDPMCQCAERVPGTEQEPSCENPELIQKFPVAATLGYEEARVGPLCHHARTVVNLVIVVRNNLYVDRAPIAGTTVTVSIHGTRGHTTRHEHSTPHTRVQLRAGPFVGGDNFTASSDIPVALPAGAFYHVTLSVPPEDDGRLALYGSCTLRVSPLSLATFLPPPCDPACHCPAAARAPSDTPAAPTGGAPAASDPPAAEASAAPS